MDQVPDNTHPDLAELDLARTGEAPADIVAHLDSCAECQALMVELRELAAELRMEPERAVRPVADREVVDFIRTQAASISPARVIPWREVVLAVAAAVALCLALVWWNDRNPAPPRQAQPPAQVRKEDINGDGVVDIVDAYLLANRVEAKGALAEEWDFNADGEVDQTDVDLLANQAVALAGEGR